MGRIQEGDRRMTQGINGVLKRMGCHIYSLSEQRKMNDKRGG